MPGQDPATNPNLDIIIDLGTDHAYGHTTGGMPAHACWAPVKKRVTFAPIPHNTIAIDFNAVPDGFLLDDEDMEVV
jgi:hypothetical protein